MQDGSSDERTSGASIVEPAEILATTSSFVPTAFATTGEVEAEGNGEGPVDWQTAMKRAIRSAAELRQRLGLPEARQASAEASFPTFVPLEFLRRIRPGDPHDPLLRQVLPIDCEDLDSPGFSADPVGDIDSLAATGLLHKYNGRALLISTGACGVHCRYCFRREFPYSSTSSRAANYRPALDYLRHRSDVEEVLLSGGDPLTIVDEKLSELISQIEAIPHVRRLRIHSRMPIVIPQRVTTGLVERLRKSRLAVWCVVHANHANELDAAVLQRLGMLLDAGIPVINQAVLLRGVNDNAAALIELCRTLINHRIGPYYLHQLDRVRGAAHFEVPVEKGRRLIDQLRQSLPGYAVPSYVVEESGQPSKTPLT